VKKILWLPLALIMTLAFIGCKEDSGPSMNEDYAGTWYFNYDDRGTGKLDFTDTTYVFSIKLTGSAEYINKEKGTVEKVSEGSLSLLCTHKWNVTTKEWDEADDTAVIRSYFRSADGKTLTIAGRNYSSTEP